MIVISHYTLSQRNAELSRVDSLLQAYNKPDSPGFSIGIVENGQLIYSQGIGFANIETGKENSGNGIFGVASIAKQFTAACVWSLIKEGRISLDDDIRKYIPEFPFYGKPILVRHILNHTTGIRNYHAIMELGGFDYDSQYHDNQTILDLACRQKGLNNLPGEKVIYGNTAYTLLAIIIERITRQNLNEYAQNKIFRPLGMNHTFYRTDTTTVIPTKVVGYVVNGESFTSVSGNQTTYGAGSLCSSVEDLAIWSNVLNGSNPDFLDLTHFLTTAEELPSGETAQYARGVMIDDYRNKRTVHHSGYGLGGQSQIIAVPQAGIAVIILTNLESIDPSPLSYKIIDLFLPVRDTESSEATQPFRHKRRDLKKFAGQYKEQSSDMQMELFIENDTLKALGSLGSRPKILVGVEKGKFVRAISPDVMYDLMPARNTNADLIVYFGGTPFYFSRANFIDAGSVDLSDFTGKYHSVELSVEYAVYVENGTLYLDYPNHSKIKLTPGQQDEFGNGQRVLYHFEGNDENEVVRLLLSAEGTVRNIEFLKKET